MTLDDLLALLPDNTTGEIDADDLRTVTTALWERAWTGPGGMLYNLRQDNASPIVPGEASCDVAWANQPSTLMFNNVDALGIAQSSWLLNLRIGARIFLYATDPDVGSGNGRVAYTVLDVPQAGPNTVEIDVSVQGASGSADEWTQATFTLDQAPPVAQRTGLWAAQASTPGPGGFQVLPVPNLDGVTSLLVNQVDIAGANFKALFTSNPKAVIISSIQDPSGVAAYRLAGPNHVSDYYQFTVTPGSLLAAGGSDDINTWGSCRLEFL